jgi:predicted O-linked N-acetylglucosamine transferase (SPINDLY family)
MTVPPSGSDDGDGSPSAYHGRGLAHLAARRLELALAELERALQLEPGNHEYAKSLGNAYKAAGDRHKAADCYRRALRIAPDHVPSLFNLGLIEREAGRLGAAEECFRRIHELAPKDLDALLHLGSLLQLRAQGEEAARIFRLVLQHAPGNAFAHHQLGLACKVLGRTDEATESFAKALELDPGLAEAHNDLGNLLQDEGRLEEAASHYRTAVRLAPGVAVAANNLGSALVRLGRLDEAQGCFRDCIAAAPEMAIAHFNLGTIHSLRGERDEALECYRTAERLRPDDAAIREGLLFELQNACDWSRFEELCERQRRSVREQSASPISPFSLLSIPSTRAEQLQCARAFSARYARAAARGRQAQQFRHGRERKSRLTIGYLSADLHEHVTAYVMAELFELHDRSRFEVVAYSYGPDDGSPMRKRLVRAFERFEDIASLSHAAAAASIHAQGVDILVDLKGYTQHARTEIVALRPAPIQVSYMGYPATMAAEFIDYMVADRFVIPEAHAADYAENLVMMPSTYYVNDRRRPVAATPPRHELGLPRDAFVFCCFNQTYKILPQVFAAWMRMLAAVPGSVLWLLEGSPRSTQNLRREAQAQGVAPERLVFAPKLPLDKHLGRARAADLFLDTAPYNAHTTATDALWVGVPVLTRAGETFVSRVAGSLLGAVGLPELVTHSIADYEALALRLAGSPDMLGALRNRLTANLTSARLFDTPAFVSNLEEAYLRMWALYAAGEAPRRIDL